MFRLFIIVNLICIVFASYELSEGDACERDGVAGTCRKIRFCPTVTLVDLKLKPPEHPQVCSYSGEEPIVCCTDCNSTDVTKMVLTTEGIQYKPGTNKSYDYCLDAISRLPYSCKIGVYYSAIKSFNNKDKCHFPKVVYKYLLIGELAMRGQFPHMALLGYGEDADAVQWSCGGSVISERFILTAGHCGAHPRLGPVSHVALGILRRTDPADVWQRHRVRRFIPHPEYKPPSKYNDIALIETDAEIKFSKLVLPICLADRELEPKLGRAEGWGAEGYNKQNSDGLRQAWLERFTDAKCDELYPQHRNQPQGVDRRTQVCFGDHKENKDTCQGDSGGPLQVGSPTRACIEYVYAVTSYGRACGFRGGAGVYTRVLPYLPWIEGNVWP